MTHANTTLPLDQILLGDCCELMAGLPAASFDTLLSDPPYGVNFTDLRGRTLAGDRDLSWLRPAFSEAYRLLKPGSISASFYSWNKVDEFVAAWRSVGFRIAGHLTFPKRYTSSSGLVRYQHENAFILAKGNPRPPENLIGDVIDWGYNNTALHPTQKPVQCLTPIIESFCPFGGVVLDPFAGSGSTLVAARIAGRHAVGMEIEPHMHTIGNQRLKRMRDLLVRSLGSGEERELIAA